jgi:hypothetical protein
MIALMCWLALSAAANDGLATEKDFKVTSDGTAAKVKAGQKGALVVNVVALNGFKVSQETPFSLKLAATDGVKLDAQTFARKDLVDSNAKDPQVKTFFTGAAKGEQTVNVDVTFFLCSDKLCQRMTAKHTIKLNIE